MGMVLYNLTALGTFFLALLMWRRGQWRISPAFFVYICFCGIRIVVLNPVFKTGTPNQYNLLCWIWLLVALPFLGAAFGELFGQKAVGGIVGGFAALASAFLMVTGRAMLATGDIAGATAQGELVIAIVRYSGLLLAVVGLCAVRHIKGIAAGLVVATTFSSIALMAQGPYRYAGSLAWIVALILWLGWAMASESRAVSSSTTYRPSLRSSRLIRGAAS